MLEEHQEEIDAHYFLDVYVPNPNIDYIINDIKIEFSPNSIHSKYDQGFMAQNGYGLFKVEEYIEWFKKEFINEYNGLVKYYGEDSVVISFGIL